MSGFSATLKKAMFASGRRDLRPPLIVATRDDGLGGRLLAMASAKSLADRLGYGFGFTWNHQTDGDNIFHVIDVVERIFSADFIEKHCLGKVIKESDFGTLKETVVSRASLDAATGLRKLRGWIYNELHVHQADVASTTQALRSFGFSSAVQQVLDAAGQRPFQGPTAALHLRSGDIVRGKYRSRLVFADKVIPSTLAKAIVSELAAKGLSTLLIGQDRDTLDYLKAETGALLADDFGAGHFGDETLRAFFEMALMARCQQIYAGSSIYARIASVMGSVPCFDTSALFSKPQAAQIILEELKAHQSAYHPLEAAFGYQSAFLNLEDEISPAQAKAVLDPASALDPDNDIYALKLAAVYFHDGDYASGEAALKSLMVRQFEARARIPLPMMNALIGNTNWGYAMAKDFAAFAAAGKAGHPYAAACSAHIIHETLRDAGQAREMARLSLRADPANPILRRIERRIRLGEKPKSGLLSRAIWQLGTWRG